MFLNNHPSCSNSHSSQPKNDYISNFRSNNSQIIALFAPKPIQSTNKSNQFLAPNNEKYYKCTNITISSQGRSTSQGQNTTASSAKNQQLSQDSDYNSSNGRCQRKYEEVMSNNSFENQKFQNREDEEQNDVSQPKRQENVRFQEQEDDEEDDQSSNIEVYRAKTQTYNHQRDLQVAGREIFQILNQSRNREQVNDRIFIESTENPHASQLDKLYSHEQPQSFSDFSTCSDINMTSCGYPNYYQAQYQYNNLQDFRQQQQEQPIHDLRSINYHDDDDADDRDEQFFFGDDDDDDDDDDQSYNNNNTFIAQNKKTVRTLQDVMAQEEEAFHSQKKSFYNIPSSVFHVSKNMNNQSQMMIPMMIAPNSITSYSLNQSQNQTRKPKNFHMQYNN